MKSIGNVQDSPARIPLLADDLVEFHAGRLLLLFRLCGVKGKITGLTKMAKLDFFVRYPTLFESACVALGLPTSDTPSSVESSMVRYHYGPWDKRYYHVLSFLEARGLMVVEREGRGYVLSLTETGASVAADLATDPSYQELAQHMRGVKKALGRRSGSSLKKLIYRLFETEVAERPLGEVIK